MFNYQQIACLQTKSLFREFIAFKNTPRFKSLTTSDLGNLNFNETINYFSMLMRFFVFLNEVKTTKLQAEISLFERKLSKLQNLCNLLSKKHFIEKVDFSLFIRNFYLFIQANLSHDNELNVMLEALKILLFSSSVIHLKIFNNQFTPLVFIKLHCFQ